MESTNNYKNRVLAVNAELNVELNSLVGAIKKLLTSDTFNNDKEARKFYTPFFGVGGTKSKVNFALENLNKVAPKNDKGEFVRTHKGEQIAKQTFSPFWVLQQAYKFVK